MKDKKGFSRRKVKAGGSFTGAGQRPREQRRGGHETVRIPTALGSSRRILPIKIHTTSRFYIQSFCGRKGNVEKSLLEKKMEMVF